MNIYTYNNIYKYVIDQIKKISSRNKKILIHRRVLLIIKNKVVSLKRYMDNYPSNIEVNIIYIM